MRPAPSLPHGRSAMVVPKPPRLDCRKEAASANPRCQCCRPRVPVVRGGPKIGRNEPCPCGSGRKYKKCCG
ncbi:MAG: SEC-C metal-binding domain-containing protein [Acidobacteriota bacterium]